MNSRLFLLPFITALLPGCNQEKPIDRMALVARNNVVLSVPDTLGSLSVGNGEFAFTVDASGLQTFYKEYENGIPLGTQSQWAWHSVPQKEKYSLSDVAVDYESCDGSKAPYAVQQKEGKAGDATNALRANPHRLHLGLIGLEIPGRELKLSDLKNLRQELDLWTGKIETTYELYGYPVKVTLFGHQQEDRISARVESKLISQGLLKIKFNFPYGKECHVCPGYEWDNPTRHTSEILSQSDSSALIKRVLDSTTYFVRLDWNTYGKFSGTAIPHHFLLNPDIETDAVEFSVLFSTNQEGPAGDYNVTKESSISVWKNFWTSGGVIDFSQCTDPRAKELERRVVLSQYLTKIQCAGSLPPQETGLTMNSWYGKFHLEMHWWHAVHFSLWDRPRLMEKSMPYYNTVITKAQSTARWRGYKGARWQKMTDPYGNESPSSVGAFIIWQQPHPIYLAEEFYRSNPGEALKKYSDVVSQSAEFMASFVKLRDGKYHLCHPLIPAQEIFKAKETDDPAFELQYWHYGLSIAQKWRERLGEKRNEEWDRILADLSPLVTADGMYLPNATTLTAYTDDQFRRDHPAVVGSMGFLPVNERIAPGVMTKTFDNIMKRWQWETTWGWDYPLLAMTAARLNKPDEAINALLMDVQKNTYLINGHNYQDKRLRLYLPGNGGLLAAVAMMTAGWDGSTGDAPGFPKDGKWNIKWEGLRRMQ